jgi:hypothetical protein
MGIKYSVIVSPIQSGEDKGLYELTNAGYYLETLTSDENGALKFNEDGTLYKEPMGDGEYKDIGVSEHLIQTNVVYKITNVKILEAAAAYCIDGLGFLEKLFKDREDESVGYIPKYWHYQDLEGKKYQVIIHNPEYLKYYLHFAATYKERKGEHIYINKITIDDIVSDLHPEFPELSFVDEGYQNETTCNIEIVRDGETIDCI